VQIRKMGSVLGKTRRRYDTLGWSSDSTRRDKSL